MKPSLKQVLTELLKSTHDKAEWFVPLNISLKGLSAEQANWKGEGMDHSIAELTTHIIFWNQNELSKFTGENNTGFSGDNNITFSRVDNESWPEIVKKADQVMILWENAVAAADEKKLEETYAAISHISTHNAYHTGQIVLIRKRQGSWDPEQGVK